MDYPLTPPRPFKSPVPASSTSHLFVVPPPCSCRQNPVHFFSHPLYKATGNLFWPDAWQGLVRDAAYSMFGLDPQRTVVRRVIRASRVQLHPQPTGW